MLTGTAPEILRRSDEEMVIVQQDVPALVEKLKGSRLQCWQQCRCSPVCG
jgi:hypothetical protein